MGCRTLIILYRLREKNRHQIASTSRFHCRLDQPYLSARSPHRTMGDILRWAWCNDGVGISTIIQPPSGTKFRYAARLEFSDPDPSTNNTTEYEALLLGLRKIKALGAPQFHHKIKFEGYNRSHRKRIRGSKARNEAIFGSCQIHGKTF